jgi:hypothetical protein
MPAGMIRVKEKAKEKGKNEQRIDVFFVGW